MTAKRLFDIGLALILLVPGLPLMALISLVVLVTDGWPAIYASERMKRPGTAFTLWKFRTMLRDEIGGERGVSGGDKRHRITKTGAFLRRSRLDELPQLFNVLIGDMSFVGPRPPTRRYVDAFPELYAQVLQCRPGITGLATILYHSHEEWLLKDTQTAAETEAIYMRRCIPRKATLDLFYRENQSMKLDCYLIYLTAAKLLPLPGRRVRRLKNKADRCR